MDETKWTYRLVVSYICCTKAREIVERSSDHDTKGGLEAALLWWRLSGKRARVC